MLKTRQDLVLILIVTGIVILLLQICIFMIQKGIDLKYEWASDGVMYQLILWGISIGIGFTGLIEGLSYRDYKKWSMEWKKVRKRYQPKK